VQAHDTYAETNPAFCAFALIYFCKSYEEIKGTPPDLPLIYLILPIVLSMDASAAFENTKITTLLSDWIQRNPLLTLMFDERVNRTLKITADALRFACLTQSLKITDQIKVTLGDKKPKKSSKTSAAHMTTFKYAERLGHWFANAGSTRTIINSFGATV
jgi:hypothetical protein